MSFEIKPEVSVNSLFPWLSFVSIGFTLAWLSSAHKETRMGVGSAPSWIKQEEQEAEPWIALEVSAVSKASPSHGTVLVGTQTLTIRRSKMVKMWKAESCGWTQLGSLLGLFSRCSRTWDRSALPGPCWLSLLETTHFIDCLQDTLQTGSDHPDH